MMKDLVLENLLKWSNWSLGLLLFYPIWFILALWGLASWGKCYFPFVFYFIFMSISIVYVMSLGYSWYKWDMLPSFTTFYICLVRKGTDLLRVYQYHIIEVRGCKLRI